MSEERTPDLAPLPSGEYLATGASLAINGLLILLCVVVAVGAAVIGMSTATGLELFLLAVMGSAAAVLLPVGGVRAFLRNRREPLLRITDDGLDLLPPSRRSA